MVFSWFLQKDCQGDPVGGAFAGDLVSQIAWRPDDCALAAVNANGGIKVWEFKVRTKTAPQGFGIEKIWSKGVFTDVFTSQITYICLYPQEDSMNKTLLWFQELLISMGNALFHPYKDNSPPISEAQPFKDDPYKNGGIA